MISLSLKSLTAIAVCLTSSLVVSAPIDGLTQRAPKVVGLDFDKVAIPLLEKRAGVHDSPLANENYFYITYLEIGSGHTKIGVDIDTGSSDLWVPGPGINGDLAAFGTFDPSTSSSIKDLGEPFSITYADKSKSTGEFYTDTISLGDGSATINNFQFAVVDQSSVGSAGILGIGLDTLEGGAAFGGKPTYPNFPVALKNAGYIDKIAYSLYLDAPTSPSGTLLFGGKDLAKIDGELVTLPHSGPANRLDVTLKSVSVNGNTFDIGIPYNLDSGTTITYLPPDVVTSIAEQFGSVGYEVQGFTVIDCEATGFISYDFDGISIEVPVEDITFDFGNGVCVLRIGANAERTILGDTFLRYAYVVYDLENSSIGLAKPNYTTDTNVVAL